MSLPGSISLLARAKNAPAGSSPVGTSGISATQVAYGSAANQVKGSAQLLFLENTAQQISNAVTGGLQIYNTVDQTTNYERTSLNWSASTSFIYTEAGGTGTVRNLALRAGTASGGILLRNTSSGSTSGSYVFNGGSSSTAGQKFVVVGTGHSDTATSGNDVFVSLTPTYNQASGTAGNTDFKISRTETSLGSGTQLFAEFLAGAAGTTSIFQFGNTGIFTKPGGTVPLITTSSAITTGAGASTGTLTNAPAAGNPTKWVPINDNGTTRYIPCW